MKVLIQLMVAAETGRDLVYFTFNDESTVKNLEKIVDIIEKHKLNVGQVYRLLNEYADEIRDKAKVNIKKFGLCQFLEIKFSENF